MDITSCTKADYDQIITHIQEFWGSDRTLNLHHPMFVYEFGNSAYIIKDGNQVAATSLASSHRRSLLPVSIS